MAAGPFLGGWLIDAVSWRWVFLLNLPLAAAVVAAAQHVPETRDPEATGVDASGALLVAGGLGGQTFALIDGPVRGASPLVVGAAAGGVVMMVAFVAVEARRRDPLLPLELFASRLLPPSTLSPSPSTSPSSAAGSCCSSTCNRCWNTARWRPARRPCPSPSCWCCPPRPDISSSGSAPASPHRRSVDDRGGACLACDPRYWRRLHEPGVAGRHPFGLGLAAMVAPLTATVLAASDPRHAGVASAVNNAVARVAGLVAVALLPALAGLSGDDYRDPAAFAAGYEIAVWIAAALAASGGIIAWLTIRDEPPPGGWAVTEPQCPLDAPPLRAVPRW